MNNFGNENIGSLLHKLTKYQTLNANCGSPSKSAIYNQKIAYYSNKLSQMGISSNNINQVGNLIGGAGEGNPIASLIQLQTQRIKDKLAGRQPSVDATGMAVYERLVDDTVRQAGEAETKYKQMITDFVGVLRMLIKELMDLENEIAKMDVPTNFDLSVHSGKINQIIGHLNTITNDPNDIAKAYAESLIADLNSQPNKFIQTGGRNKSRYQYGGAPTHKDLLAVELRQLAQLLNINVSDTTTDTENKEKILELFKDASGNDRVTNTDANTVVSEYVNTKLLDRLRESKSELGVAEQNLLNINTRKIKQQINDLEAKTDRTSEENEKLEKLKLQITENPKLK